ncbi:hypothetical protein DXG01_007264 [Tephrocybe rancida]|nr:hypothetical protein DXG01_007264 [Tephrocybe rancida]
MALTPWQVVVDDSNPQIKYSGTWFTDFTGKDDIGILGPIFNKTSHGTSGNNSLAFSFVGTSITVFGTTGLTQVDPTWECVVDNFSIRLPDSLTMDNNNVAICQELGLEQGPHELVVKVTTQGTPFWFDRLLYTPSPDATFQNDAVFLVNSSDSSVQYSSGWASWADVANITQVRGSTAKFDFVGNSVTLVANICPLPSGSTPIMVSISIDNGPEDDIWIPDVPRDNKVYYNEPIYTTPDLNLGPHSLLLTYKGDSAGTPAFVLDHMLVQNGSLSRLAATPVSSASTARTTPTSDTPLGNPAHQLPTGGIVGGVIGGLAIISLLFFLLWTLNGSGASPLGPQDMREMQSRHGVVAHDVRAEDSPPAYYSL